MSDPTQPQPQPQPRRSNAVAITTGVVGGVLLLGAIGTAAVAGMLSLNRGSSEAQTIEVDTAGVARLEIESSAARFRMECSGDAASPGGTAAVLETSRGGQLWSMEVDGGTLRVESKGSWWDRFGWGGIGQLQTVTLTVPWQLACDERSPLNIDIGVGAGSFDGAGAFDELDIDLGAGEVEVRGSAATVNAEVSAGSADLDLTGVRIAELSVSAGSLEARLAEQAPEHVQIDVSAGELKLWVPDEQYRVTEQASAGSIDNGLRTSSTSRQTIAVDVSAGKVTLRPIE